MNVDVKKTATAKKASLKLIAEFIFSDRSAATIEAAHERRRALELVCSALGVRDYREIASASDDGEVEIERCTPEEYALISLAKKAICTTRSDGTALLSGLQSVLLLELAER
jgi:hypothetical protein